MLDVFGDEVGELLPVFARFAFPDPEDGFHLLEGNGVAQGHVFERSVLEQGKGWDPQPFGLAAAQIPQGREQDLVRNAALAVDGSVFLFQCVVIVVLGHQESFA